MRRTPAEEARTLIAGARAGTLATLSEGDDPWASLVAYAALPDGSPVFCVSTLAEHGRNLRRDARASLLIADVPQGDDALDAARVTLAGRCVRPEGERLEAARACFAEAVPMARDYADFGDFAVWVLAIERVRWVGGYGRMDWADPDAYAAAEPDPVAPAAAGATAHLNADHADALLEIAQALGGLPDATAAMCQRCDRYGIDLWVETPRGGEPCRVGFAEVVSARDGLRAATIELVRRARAAGPPAGQ